MSRYKELTDVNIMSRGHKGDLVAVVQHMVGAVPDGYFGPKTADAVRSFQKDCDLVANGVVSFRLILLLLGANFKPERPVESIPVAVDPKPTVEGGRNNDLAELYHSMEILPAWQSVLDRTITTIIDNYEKYMSVSSRTAVPIPIIAAIHHLEGGGNFNTHLHNGDPLSGRTYHVPANRPKGNPPFTWEESAVDALIYDDMDRHDWGDIGSDLLRIEGFNGMGYRKRKVNSPYLWSGSQHGIGTGKYVADGKYDPNAVSKQLGAACILKGLGYAND